MMLLQGAATTANDPVGQAFIIGGILVVIVVYPFLRIWWLALRVMTALARKLETEAKISERKLKFNE